MSEEERRLINEKLDEYREDTEVYTNLMEDGLIQLNGEFTMKDLIEIVKILGLK